MPLTTCERLADRSPRGKSSPIQVNRTRSRQKRWPLAAAVGAWLLASAQAEMPRIWLTHQSSDPSRIVVNWETEMPAASVVHFGRSASLGQTAGSQEKTTLHQVEIPTPDKDGLYHYAVGDGKEMSAQAVFKGYPSDELRVAVVGDWGYAMDRDLTALQKDDVHLLITAGDNVPSLHEKGIEGMKAFSALIDSQRELFRTTPFMPILGNHDKEAHSRGPKPPAEAVYDVDAKDYRTFFALPGDEWKWTFDIPGFDVRFFALDLEHIQDFGTTWQTCHAFGEDSEQFRWYKDTLAGTKAGFVFTVMNEKQTALQGRTKGLWHEQFKKTSALITGFGYFADRAELDGGLPYFNTCLKGNGDAYKDPRSKFFASQDNYLLLRFRKGEKHMTVQFNNLHGEVMDTLEIARRPE